MKGGGPGAQRRKGELFGNSRRELVHIFWGDPLKRKGEVGENGKIWGI